MHPPTHTRTPTFSLALTLGPLALSAVVCEEEADALAFVDYALILTHARTPTLALVLTLGRVRY